MDGDTLPETLPWRDLLLTMDDAEHWGVGMRCPCGFGDTIELLVAADSPEEDGTRDRRDLGVLHGLAEGDEGVDVHLVRCGRKAG